MVMEMDEDLITIQCKRCNSHVTRQEIFKKDCIYCSNRTVLCCDERNCQETIIIKLSEHKNISWRCKEHGSTSSRADNS